MIERFNKILCEFLVKLRKIEDWDLKVLGVLCAYQTKRNSSIKIEPEYLIYGRQMKILMNLEDNEITIKERINELIEETPKLRIQFILPIANFDITNHMTLSQ